MEHYKNLAIEHQYVYSFLEKVNQDIDTKLNTIGDDPITNIVEDIDNDLNQMKLFLQQVQEKKDNDN